MSNLKVLVVLLALLIANAANALDIRLTTEARYDKQVNNNAGLELLVKSTIALNEYTDIKIGFSEGYTAHRARPYSMNHAGHRMDIGFLWKLPYDFKFGYTHSVRSWFEGANPKDLYDYDSVDSLVIRKEFDFSID